MSENICRESIDVLPRVRGRPWSARAGRALLGVLIATSLCLVPAPSALGAKKEHKSRLEEMPAEGAGGADKSYVLPYFLVGLSMGLGLMAVCRAEKRADKAKKKVVDDDE